MIPYGRHHISADDIQAVRAVLESDWLTQGPKVPEFEQSVASSVQARYGVAMSSATAALHGAYKALDLGAGDTLWTSPNTFVATANAALYCGASVEFVDIHGQTYCLDMDALEDRLDQAARRGTAIPKIVCAVHFAGQSCDMKRLAALAQNYGFRIVEDASHAIGGDYLNDPVGSCKYSDIAVFSFHPVKIITTGEGGVAVTNDPNLAELMRRFRSHGITRDPEYLSKKQYAPWYYEQIDLGFNYRMTDIQAALGISQLKRLSTVVEGRHRVAAYYSEVLADLPLALPFQSDDCRSSYHLYVVCLDRRRTSVGRDDLYPVLRENGIGVNVHYIPVYRQPWYRQLGVSQSNCPVMEAYFESCITLPMFPNLDEKDLHHICGVLRGSLS